MKISLLDIGFPPILDSSTIQSQKLKSKWIVKLILATISWKLLHFVTPRNHFLIPSWCIFLPISLCSFSGYKISFICMWMRFHSYPNPNCSLAMSQQHHRHMIASTLQLLELTHNTCMHSPSWQCLTPKITNTPLNTTHTRSYTPRHHIHAWLNLGQTSYVYVCVPIDSPPMCHTIHILHPLSR